MSETVVMHGFRKGSRVRWNRGTGIGMGVVTDRFERLVERTINGAKIARIGSTHDPAYLIALDDGGEILKLESELTAL
ncbi:DUF2945 domain-containing protein [Sphingobium aquiterrae]|uniref:DUF2945 domain-containing protein n=1 Tax=Sphingobium aquiterrae TaxID=2038656 RepID=UPI0030169721